METQRDKEQVTLSETTGRLPSAPPTFAAPRPGAPVLCYGFSSMGQTEGKRLSSSTPFRSVLRAGTGTLWAGKEEGTRGTRGRN